MARALKWKAGCRITSGETIYEGFAKGDDCLTANVGVDKIEEVLGHFIVMRDEPLFFILELPSKVTDETEAAPGILRETHKDVYYIDSLSPREAVGILSLAGDLLYNDGVSAFGFGGHESADEIMFGKYNVLTIHSRNIAAYDDFFGFHDIEETDRLKTGWDTLAEAAPGICERYEADGKSVFDIPEMFKDWGIYFAERREE